MLSKINWPYSHEKLNPFGGPNGFRNLSITFDNESFNSASRNEQNALEILYGLAKLEHIDTLSFDDRVYPKVVFNSFSEEDDQIALRVVDTNNVTTTYAGIPRVLVDKDAILRLTGTYSSSEVEKNENTFQILLRIEAHNALRRDIFISLSQTLWKAHNSLGYINLRTPSDALKIVSLYLRMRGESEWVSLAKGNVHYITSVHGFYQTLARALLPNNWKYISSLRLHSRGEELFDLGLNVIDRCARVLQARDYLARFFVLTGVIDTENQRSYHFDYLTLLLTAALDSQALIINKVHNLGLRDYECGFRRSAFNEAINNNPNTINIKNILTAKKPFIDILFKLRNKVHSASLKEDFSVPEMYPDELLEKIYLYDPSNHWGVEKTKVTIIKNRGPRTPSFNYSIELYILAYHLVDETFGLINNIMNETGAEMYLDATTSAKMIINPPTNMLPYIENYPLLT